jgi:hypothetical protein
MSAIREPYGEAFWRAHHEAWQGSALNQREYCEAQRIPLKASGNWRAKFKAEPQRPTPKLLYQRGSQLSRRPARVIDGSSAMHAIPASDNWHLRPHAPTHWHTRNA